MRISFLFILLSFVSFGQDNELKSAKLEYQQVSLPGLKKYNEFYSISDSRMKHYSENNRTGKNKKKRLKTSPEFVEAMKFLDSILTAEYYVIAIDSVEINKIKADTAWQQKYGFVLSDIEIFDSLNQVKFEKNYFNRKIVVPTLGDTTFQGRTRMMMLNFESHVIDGTPFQLKFFSNTVLKVDYSSNLFDSPANAKYSEWFSIYLMQKQYQLFEKDHPVAYFFNDKNLPVMIRKYLFWKKYGLTS